MPKAKTITLPFPIRGVDRNWAHARQPSLTTPDALNVRAYSTDEERSRGGSRPGMTAAYPSPPDPSNAKIQAANWLDWGFGDAVEYEDAFDYTAGALSGVTKDNDGSTFVWSDAAAGLAVLGGYVHLSGGGGLPYSDVSSGEYKLFGTDDWQDFTLEVGLQWNWGTTVDLTLWVSSSSGAATDGVLLKFSVDSSVIPAPGAGFTERLTIDCQAEGGGTTNRKYWHATYGALVQILGGVLRVEAKETTIKVFLDDREVLSMDRPAGAAASTANSKAGFKMSMSKPSGSTMADALLDFRLLHWYLDAGTRNQDIDRKFVAIAGRKVYAESSAGTMGASAADTDQLADVLLYSTAPCNGRLYITDGSAPMFYDPLASSDAVRAWTARKGAIDKTCALVANWRGRLLLARSKDDPQNVFASRVGDPYDFDYGQDDDESAVAFNGTANGRISDPVTALCPITEDVLIVGTTRAIYAVHGDPAAGGMVRKVSDEIGILCQSAWCMDAEGNFYFLSHEGLYVMRPLGSPKGLTGQRVPALVTQTPIHSGESAGTGKHYVTMAYDSDRDGLNIWLTAYDADGESSHWWYDLRNDGLWPESFAADGDNPTCAIYYNALADAYRRMVVGTKGGMLGTMSDSAKSDDLTEADMAILSSVWYAPRQIAGDGMEYVLTALHATLSLDSDDAEYSLHTANTVEGVLDAAAFVSGTLAAGRNQTRPRVRGSAVGVKLSNTTSGSAWAAEQITAEVVLGGRIR